MIDIDIAREVILITPNLRSTKDYEQTIMRTRKSRLICYHHELLRDRPRLAIPLETAQTGIEPAV